MKQYLELLEDVMRHGERTADRTGTGTYSVFGRQLRFNLDYKHYPPISAPVSV